MREQLGIDDDPFVGTVATLPYRFVPFLFLVALAASIALRKDIGPISRYPLPSAPAAAAPPRERGAAGLHVVAPSAADGAGALDPKPGTPCRAANALLPFGTIALVTFGGMLLDGAAKLRAKAASEGGEAALSLVAVLGESDSISALVWSSALGWLVSLGLVLSQARRRESSPA